MLPRKTFPPQWRPGKTWLLTVEYGEGITYTRTCIVKTVQHRGFPEVQFTKMQGLQGGAHRLARLPQALQSLALGHHQLPLALFVNHVSHRGASAASAPGDAPAPGGAAPGGGSW